MSNAAKTVLLMGLLTGLILSVGGLLGGSQGMVLALVLAAVMNFSGYFFSDRIALRMYRARALDRGQAPQLFSMVEALTLRAGVPMPRLYRIPSPTPNAFATGRDPAHAALAVTDGIVELLDEEELRGVIAHELGHVANRDILISSVAATLAGAIMMLARFAIFFPGSRQGERSGGPLVFLLTILLAPLAAMLIQMAVSRNREYAADATGARIVGHPGGLARALKKLEASNRRLPMNAQPSTAHMFIVNPLKRSFLVGLFSTHPPIEKRIARLLGRPA